MKSATRNAKFVGSFPIRSASVMLLTVRHAAYPKRPAATMVRASMPNEAVPIVWNAPFMSVVRPPVPSAASVARMPTMM